MSLSRSGKLELKKTVETGQVRQSFSHGRSKVVAVEVRKKRTYALDSGGQMAEVKPGDDALKGVAFAPPDMESIEAGEIPDEARQTGPSLTTEEKAARVRALQDAMKAEDAEAVLAGDADATALEGEEPAALTPEEEAKEREQAEADDTRRRAEEEAVRVAEDEEARRREEQARAAAATAAAKLEGRRGRGQPRGKPKRSRSPRPGRAARELPASGGIAPRPTEAAYGVGKADHRRGARRCRDERTRSLASVREGRGRGRRQKIQKVAESGRGAEDHSTKWSFPETISVQELANRMAERGVDVIKSLMKMGVMAGPAQPDDRRRHRRT